MDFDKISESPIFGISLLALAVLVIALVIWLKATGRGQSERANRITSNIHGCLFFIVVGGILGTFAVAKISGLIHKPAPSVPVAAVSESKASADGFKARYDTGEALTPEEFQSSLMFKDMPGVVALLGRPNSAHEGDTEWYYDKKVLHPITGKPDTLIIKFEVNSIGSQVVYLQAGIDGTKLPLK